MSLVWNPQLGRYMSKGGTRTGSGYGFSRPKKMKHKKPLAGVPKGLRMRLLAHS